MKTEIDEDSFILKYSELNLLYDTLRGVALAKVGFFVLHVISKRDRLFYVKSFDFFMIKVFFFILLIVPIRNFFLENYKLSQFSLFSLFSPHSPFSSFSSISSFFKFFHYFFKIFYSFSPPVQLRQNG